MFRNLHIVRPAAVAVFILAGWSGIGTAGAQSVCADLAATVDPDQSCHLHSATNSYTLDFRFPVDYPDQQALTDYLTQRRDEFVNYALAHPPRDRPMPYSLDITGKAYRSGTPAAGTQSLVFNIADDEGAAHEGHPATSYQALNYDLAKGAPITFDTLFKPGAKPLEVLSPIVEPALEKHWGAAVLPPLHDAGANAYRNFAINDDAVIFFFGEDQLLPDNIGPYEVSVPRTQLASLLT